MAQLLSFRVTCQSEEARVAGDARRKAGQTVPSTGGDAGFYSKTSYVWYNLLGTSETVGPDLHERAKRGEGLVGLKRYFHSLSQVSMIQLRSAVLFPGLGIIGMPESALTPAVSRH